MRKVLFIFSLLYSTQVISQTTEPIAITTQSINIPGNLLVAAWQSEHKDQPFPNYPCMHYALCKGDEVVIDFATENKKGTQRITVTEFESKSVTYSNNSFQTLEALKIQIPKTGVYKFEFATNHMFDRQCKLNMKRIPSSEAPKSFNHLVTWKTISDTTFNVVEEQVKVATKFEPVTVQSPQHQFINSEFKYGGKTRTSFPIVLPPNTVEWYYTFAATRNKADIDRTESRMKLFGELTKIIDKTGTLSFAVDALSKPPGADYCDVYLLTEETNDAFIAGTNFRHYPDVSRSNLMSGVVKVKNCCLHGRYYIGFKNTDLTHGIAAMIEVVAITQKDTYETRKIKKVVSITSRQHPVANN